MKGSFRFRFWRLAALAIMLMLVLPWTALADTVEPDNDLVTTGDQTFVNLGNVSPGATLHPQVSFTLECGGNRHVDAGQTVTVAYTTGGSTIPPDGSMSATSATIGAIPGAWPDDGNNCPSPAPSPLGDNGNSIVTITAPTAPGTYTYLAKYGGVTLSPAGGNDPASVTGNVQVTFQLTVVSSDTTPPSASPSQSPAANGAGWNNSDVTVTWNWSDAGSGIDPANCTTSSTSSGEGTITLSATCKDLAGNIGSASYDVKVDKTAPTISAAATTDPNAAGWYNTNVTVYFSCLDTLSGIPDGTCPADQVLSDEGAAVASTAQTVTDAAGNTSGASNLVTVKIDKTAPTVSVTGVANGATYTLGSVPAAGCDTQDVLSGVATSAFLSISGGNANGVGSFTATCSGALDKADNPGASVSATYSVIYNWNGFFRPVDNPTIVSTVKAGSAIPVKFSLSGNQGLNIFADGYPQSAVIACDSTARVDLVEATVAASQSGLSYDSSADQYVYVWKTEKSWSGTCRQLVVTLNDGTEHQANFKFNK